MLRREYHAKDSDMAEKLSPVEMCEEETQVGHSLVHVEKEKAEDGPFPVAYGVIDINTSPDKHERDESDKRYYDKINSVLAKPENKALRSKTLRLSSYSPYIQFSEEQDQVTRLTFDAEGGDNDPTDEEYMDPDEEVNDNTSETTGQCNHMKSDEEPTESHTLKADYKLNLSTDEEPSRNGVAAEQNQSGLEDTSDESSDKKISDSESCVQSSEESTISSSGRNSKEVQVIVKRAEGSTTDTEDGRDKSPPKYAKIQPKSVKANWAGRREASELQLVAAEKPTIGDPQTTEMSTPENSSCSSTDTNTQEEGEVPKKRSDSETRQADPKKEKLDAPTETADISGPLLVTLALGTEWKRRYLSLVGENLYIWTSHK